MTLVWYHPELDEIFLSWYLDGCFFALCGDIRWDLVELLGEL